MRYRFLEGNQAGTPAVLGVIFEESDGSLTRYVVDRQSPIGGRLDGLTAHDFPGYVTISDLRLSRIYETEPTKGSALLKHMKALIVKRQGELEGSLPHVMP
ncbi:MAG: hypothetical protein ACOX9B_14465 [Candidatus Xenobium sp.]|jgi:hypothetical protein